MDKKRFRSLMHMAKSFQELDQDRADFWRGFQRGLRRLFHGKNFGTDEEHAQWLNCQNGDYRQELQTGYRTGFYYDRLQLETGADIQPLRKLLGLSVAALAKIAAVSPRTVEGWEQGRPIPRAAIQLIRKYLMLSST